jgi:hypothetical protein
MACYLAFEVSGRLIAPVMEYFAHSNPRKAHSQHIVLRNRMPLVSNGHTRMTAAKVIGSDVDLT